LIDATQSETHTNHLLFSRSAPRETTSSVFSAAQVSTGGRLVGISSLLQADSTLAAYHQWTELKRMLFLVDFSLFSPQFFKEMKQNSAPSPASP
jgi:hypothetical protein